MSNFKLHFTVPGDDFTRAGEASGSVKKTLKDLGCNRPLRGGNQSCYPCGWR